KDGFRQPRNLKEKDVPASQYLPGLRRQKAAHNRGMRHIDHGEFCDALRMQECCAPGYRSAPIVTRKKDLLLPELVGHRDHVGNELGQRVRSQEHTSELQSLASLVCRLLREQEKKT